MQRVEVPDIAPAKGGLLSVANVQTAPGGAALQRGVDYRTRPCGPARDVPTDGSEKQFDDPETVTGTPFAIYRGTLLSLLDEADISAEDLLDSGSSFAVEAALQRTVLNPTATVVGDPTGVSPRMALALLEQYAGERYMGVPTFHVNRFGAVFMPLETESEDGVVTTKQGSFVANGAGYGPAGPGGVNAEAGQFWLYVTGQVNLWRSEILTREGYDLKKNQRVLLAERIYIPTVECIVAAVLVNAE